MPVNNSKRVEEIAQFKLFSEVIDSIQNRAQVNFEVETSLICSWLNTSMIIHKRLNFFKNSDLLNIAIFSWTTK